MWSSKRGDWKTPFDLYEWLDEQFHFTLDPCADPSNNLGTPKFYTEEDDGLAQSWRNERCYINPEYGRVYPKWVMKAYNEVMYGGCKLAVILLPARTDTIVFHDYCVKGEIWFLKGRLHFDDGPDPAPFPSMLVIFREGELD